MAGKFQDGCAYPPSRGALMSEKKLMDGEDERRVFRPFDRREAITVSVAAKRAGMSESTIRYWCILHAIGRRIAGGNWKVSSVALQMLLDHNLEALANYHTGVRTHPDVAAYFEREGLGCLLIERKSDNAKPW
jgi:hypothetical protein